MTSAGPHVDRLLVKQDHEAQLQYIATLIRDTVL